MTTEQQLTELIYLANLARDAGDKVLYENLVDRMDAIEDAAYSWSGEAPLETWTYSTTGRSLKITLTTTEGWNSESTSWSGADAEEVMKLRELSFDDMILVNFADMILVS